MTWIAIPSSSNLKIAVDRVGDDAMLRLSGRVDVDSSPDLRCQPAYSFVGGTIGSDPHSSTWRAFPTLRHPASPR